MDTARGHVSFRFFLTTPFNVNNIMDTARGGRSLAVLDAGVVNVYQGANAVIFMVDPYRPETLDKVGDDKHGKQSQFHDNP